MMTTKNERLGLLVATVIFTLVGAIQFWRAIAGVPLVFNGTAIPAWVSVIAGIVAWGMAFWMNKIMQHMRRVI